MFDAHLKSTGRDYSMTIALLAAAVVFVPAVLLAFGSASNVALTLAGVCSCVCVLLAWVNWKRHSRLTIPTLEDEPTIPK